MKRLLLIVLPLYALDQLTKTMVVRSMEVGDARPVIDGFFELVHVINTGAAFGSFRNGNLFFILLSVAVFGMLAYFYKKGAFPGVWPQTGLALFLAGILGNLTDRLVHGHVVDFLSFDLHVPFASPWPAFNVADSCICVAASIFVLHSFFAKNDATH
jgi:signal peptidase II